MCITHTPHTQGHQPRPPPSKRQPQAQRRAGNRTNSTATQHPPAQPTPRGHRPWHAAAAHTQTAPPSSHTPAPAYAPPTTASANSNEATQPRAGMTVPTGPPGCGPPASSRPARPCVGGVASPSRQASRLILVMTMMIVRSFAVLNIVFVIAAPQAKRRTNTTEPKRTDTHTPQGGGPDGGPVRPPVRDVNSAEGSRLPARNRKAARRDAEVALQAGATPASEETDHAFRWSARP